MRRKFLLCLTGLFFAMGAYKAWEEQYEIAAAANNASDRYLAQTRKFQDKITELNNENKLNLAGNIIRMDIGTVADDPTRVECAFRFIVEILNKSLKRSSIAEHWKLKVFFPNNTNPIEAEIMAPLAPGEIATSHGVAGNEIYVAEDDLRTKAGFSPIPPGGKTIGYISFSIQNMNSSQIPLGTKFELTFQDVDEKNIICGGFANYDPKNILNHTYTFPTKQGNFLTKQGNFLTKQGNFLTKQGNFPAKQGNFPAKQGDFGTVLGNFAAKQSNFPTKSGDFAAKLGDFTASVQKMNTMYQNRTVWSRRTPEAGRKRC